MPTRPRRPGGGGPDPERFLAAQPKPTRCAACLLPPEARAALDAWIRRYPDKVKLAPGFLKGDPAQGGGGFSGEAIDRITGHVVRHHRDGGHVGA